MNVTRRAAVVHIDPTTLVLITTVKKLEENCLAKQGDMFCP